MGKGPRQAQLTMRLTHDLKGFLEAYAEAHRVSVSTAAARLMERGAIIAAQEAETLREAAARFHEAARLLESK